MEVVQIIKELIAAAGPLHGAAGQGVFGAAVIAEGVCLIAEIQLALGRPEIWCKDTNFLSYNAIYFRKKWLIC